MKLRGGLLSVAIAIASGLLVLPGYFLSGDVLLGIRTELLNWAVILAGFAALVGIFNLLLVHIEKVRKKQKGAAYSLILVIALTTTFLLGVILKPDNKIMVDLFKAVQLPVETSLMALLAVTLTYASIRLLRQRLNLFSIIFLVTVLLMLVSAIFVGDLIVVGGIPLLSGYLRPAIAQVLAAGGARGILIGVALGALTTGLRVLIGADRPYGGHK